MYIKYDNVGLNFIPLGGEDNVLEMVLKDNSKIIPADVAKANYNINLSLKQYCVDYENVYFNTLKYVIDEKMKMSPMPVFIFDRTNINRTNVFYVIACYSVDIVFFREMFGLSPMYINQRIPLYIFSLPKSADISVETIRSAWKDFLRNTDIISFSNRFFMIRYKKYILLYTFGLSKDETLLLRKNNFKFDREKQIWIALANEDNYKKVFDLIQFDSLPSLDELGYVPIWYTELRQGQSIMPSRSIKDDTVYNLLLY